MADLLLHEQRVDPVLDQVRDRGVAQAMHRQLSRQPGRPAPQREPIIDLPGRDPPAPLGQPHPGCRCSSPTHTRRGNAAATKTSGRIVREFFPKGVRITSDPNYLAMVASEINDRPRKIHNWKKPSELFAELVEKEGYSGCRC